MNKSINKPLSLFETYEQTLWLTGVECNQKGSCGVHWIKGNCNQKTKIKILNSYKPFFETDRRTLLLIEVLFAIKRDIIGFIVV